MVVAELVGGIQKIVDGGAGWSVMIPSVKVGLRACRGLSAEQPGAHKLRERKKPGCFGRVDRREEWVGEKQVPRKGARDDSVVGASDGLGGW
jgi:hypothetical protein